MLGVVILNASAKLAQFIQFATQVEFVEFLRRYPRPLEARPPLGPARALPELE